ncbi:MAG: SH3 domain-containing protein [Verrucomicrobiota bacterium]
MKLIHPLIFAVLLTLPVGAQALSPTNPPPESEIITAPPADAKPLAKKTAPKKTKAKKVKPALSPGGEPNAQSTLGRVKIDPPESGLVKQDAVNVRGQASFIGEVITKLKKGETVTLLEEISIAKPKKDEPPRWFRIAMPSNTPVWVNASFIDPSAKTVVPKKLKVRAGPGENFSAVGILKKGAVVKEIRTVNEWTEIETPAETSAFVAADLIERASSTPPPTLVPLPPTEPDVATVPPAATNAEPDVAKNPPTNATPENLPPPTVPTPPVAQTAPPVVPPPVVEEPLPKRVVTREGIIRRSINVQTPSYYGLENPENRKIINYLYKAEPGFTLKPWIGVTVVVTGEESVDPRWPNTPVIQIQTIENR